MPVNLDSIQSAYRAAPGLDPNVTSAVANVATDDGDAATAAQATQAMGESLTSVNTLRAMDTDDQIKFWNAAQPAQRQLWTAAGYAAPPKKKGRWGLFGKVERNVVHGTRDVLGAPSAALRQAGRIPVVGAVPNAIADVGSMGVGGVADTGKSVIHGVATVGMAGQHAYRAYEAIEKGTANVDENGNVTQHSGAIKKAGGGYLNLSQGWTKNFFSPDAWSRAWSATNKGERTFDNSQFQRIVDDNQGKTIDAAGVSLPMVEVAAAMASGTIEDYAKNKLKDNPDALGALNQAVNTNPELKAIQDDLQNHKLSFGRMITPDSLWVSHPGLAHGISGAGDAIFDIKSDPTLYAGKARKAQLSAKYGIKAPEDVEKVMASPAGDRAATQIAERLSNKDYAGVLNRFPSTAGMLPKLASEDIKTPEDLVNAMELPTNGSATKEDVKDWIKTRSVASRILIGDGSAAGKDAIIAPHVTALGSRLLDSKEFLNKSIDWSKEVTLPRVGNLTDSTAVAAASAPVNAALAATETSFNIMGAAAKKMTTLLPEGRSFNPNSTDALMFVQRFAYTYLDRDTANHIVNAWASAGYNTSAKRNIYMDMLGKVFESAGMNNSDRGQQMMARYLQNSEQAFLRQKYASNGIDKIISDGKAVAHGITKDQLTEEWSLPSYKAMSAVAQRGTISKIVYGVGNNELANGFNAIWKPAQLLRFGFPIRVSLDELAGGILRNGLTNTVRAKLAKPVAETLAEYERGLDPEHAALLGVRSPLEIVAATMAQRTKYAMAKTGKAFVGDQYYLPIKRGIENGSLDKSFTEEISARHGGINLTHDEDTAISLLKEGYKTTKVYFRPGDEYRDYKVGNDLHTAIWKKRLDSIANDDASRFVLENIDMPADKMQRAIADKLQNEWRDVYWAKGARAHEFGDNRVVGLNATEDEAAMDWAGVIMSNVDQLVREPSMEELPYGLRQIPLNRDLKASRRPHGVEFEVTPGGRGTHVPTRGISSDNAKVLTIHRTPEMDFAKPKKVSARGATTFNDVPKITPGTVALKHIATDKQYERILRLPKDRLVSELKSKFPSHDYKFMGRDELLGAYGAQLARKRGHKAILVNHPDGTSSFAALEDSAVHTAAGKPAPIQDLLEHMHQHRSAPDMETLKNIPDELKPAVVTGPEHVPLRSGGLGAWMKDFTERGFDYIGKTIDWMARQPLYLHNFAAADNELRPIIEEAFGKGEASEQVLKELISARAIRNTTPFIHNPELRSQMNVMTQNFLPFQFAQEQFYKRWVRTFAHSPEAIRKAQLAANSLSATGIVHKDDTGEEVFSYPLVGHAQKAVAGIATALGFDSKVALHGGFSGQLKMVAPGLDRTFAPAFGPLISLPTTVAAKVFPELEPVRGELLGEIGASKSWWEQIVPSSIARLTHVFNPDTAKTQYNSAMMKTMQDIAVSKYDDKDPHALDKWFQQLEQDPKAKQQLLDQVKNGTRINVALRALLGFAAPAAPQSEIGNTVFARRMRELQAEGLDFTTAMQELIKQDPSLTPYAVFMSEAAGKEPLPSTKESLESLDKHQDFYRDHPEAGGFLLPIGPTDSAYNSEAYRLEMAYQMRMRKSPEKFLDQLIYDQAANDYFDTRDDYIARSANLKGPAKQELDQKWASFKQNYYQANPQFAYMLQTSTAAPDRAQTLKSLQTALNDHRAPQGPQTESIRDVVDTYTDYQSRLAVLAGRSDSTATRARKALKLQTTSILKDYVDKHPESKSAYNTLIKPDLEGVD